MRELETHGQIDVEQPMMSGNFGSVNYDKWWQVHQRVIACIHSGEVTFQHESTNPR